MTEHYLGIDVGFAADKATTGLCLLTIDQTGVSWRCENTWTDETRRQKALRALVPAGTTLAGVGIDGPLTSGLTLVRHYRSAEALLTRGPFQRRGKPGQTSAPTGQQLHKHATALAKIALNLEQVSILPATHPDAIHENRIAEAFPTAFLSVLLPESSFSSTDPRVKSDLYWTRALENGRLHDLLTQTLAPGRVLHEPMESISHHDARAALLCALVAVCVARGRYVAVGDPIDGDIILPPADLWGRAFASGGEPWAQATLRSNVATVRQGAGNHTKARVVSDGAVWE